MPGTYQEDHLQHFFIPLRSKRDTWPLKKEEGKKKHEKVSENTTLSSPSSDTVSLFLLHHLAFGRSCLLLSVCSFSHHTSTLQPSRPATQCSQSHGHFAVLIVLCFPTAFPFCCWGSTSSCFSATSLSTFGKLVLLYLAKSNGPFSSHLKRSP